MTKEVFTLTKKRKIVYLLFTEDSAICKIGYFNGSVSNLVSTYRRAYGCFQGTLSIFEDDISARLIEKIVHDKLKNQKLWKFYEIFTYNSKTVEIFKFITSIANKGKLHDLDAQDGSVMITCSHDLTILNTIDTHVLFEYNLERCNRRERGGTYKNLSKEEIEEVRAVAKTRVKQVYEKMGLLNNCTISEMDLSCFGL